MTDTATSYMLHCGAAELRRFELTLQLANEWCLALA